MGGVPVAELAVARPWLAPSVPAFLALTADPPDPVGVWADPIAVAHVLRFAKPTSDPIHFDCTPAMLSQPGLCSHAAALLSAFPDLTLANADPTPARRVASEAGRIARELASIHGVPPGAADALARLAPLGWEAVGSIDPLTISDAPADAGLQRELWGLDAAAIARRLAGRWRLPTWATTILGYLHLATDDAVGLGASAELFRVVRAAVVVAERRHGTLGLTDPRIGADDDWIRQAEQISSPPPAITADPITVPREILVRLLTATATARRATGATWLAEAEVRIDTLTRTLADLRADYATDLRDAKLLSLAELAAGASHEINNPLAVISGQAQLLLSKETDADRRKQLGSIVRQTNRVHDILHGTLQFARPPRPVPTVVKAADWLADLIATHRPDAEARGVTLTGTADAADGFRADVAQVKLAVGHLVRNAVAIVPEGGWVTVTVSQEANALVAVVEDSGPGPAPADVPHLFDPFFSGRTAGRGRGLGLAIAWRLAHLNGGDVRYAPTPGGPTRFLFAVPYANASEAPAPRADRRSA